MSSEFRQRLKQLRAPISAPGDAWRGIPDRLRGLENASAILEGLTFLAENDFDVEVRFRAKKILDELGADPCGPAAPEEAAAPEPGRLRDALRDRSSAQRVLVLKAFARRHGACVAEEIVSFLMVEEDPVVLANGLGLLADTGSVEILRSLKGFLGHENDRVVATAVETMGIIDADASLPMLLPTLIRDDNRTRANILMVLVAQSPDEVIAYLARMGASLKEAYRSSAMWCFRKLSEEGRLSDGDLEEVLLSMLAREASVELTELETRLLERVATPEALGTLHRMREEQPVRTPSVERIISAVKERHSLTEKELEEKIHGPAKEPPPLAPLTGLSGEWKRPDLGLLTSRPTASTPVQPPSRRPGSRILRLAVPLVALVLIAGAGWWWVQDPPQEPVVAHASPHAPRTRTRSIIRAPALPSGKQRIEGKIVSRKGDTLVLRRGGTVYAVRFPEAGSLRSHGPGEDIVLEGRYMGWDSFLGFVRIEGVAVIGPG